MIRKLCVLLLSFYCLQTVAQAGEILVFAVDIVRHGDRTAFHEIPAAYHRFYQGKGQLTAEGMQQHFLLGKKLRERYVHQYHLLPEAYHKKFLYVRSSDTDRTLMSGQSLLMGLYPVGTGPRQDNNEPGLPLMAQAIPIHTVDKSTDTVLAGHTHTKEGQAILEKYVYSQNFWTEKNRQLKSQFQRWSNLTGLHISDLEDSEKLGDTLNVYRLHHIKLPIGLSENEADEIINLGFWVLANKIKPQAMGLYLGGDLLKQIASQIDKQLKNETKGPKAIIYISHDVILGAVLSALGAPLEETTVPYAADLNFSLFKLSSGVYELRISLNDKTVKIPFCQSSCDPERFVEYVKQITRNITVTSQGM